MASLDEEAVKVVLSVLMVAGGNPEISAAAVGTLRWHSKIDFQLVFVDNGSTENMNEAIKPHIRAKDIFIRYNVGRSFAGANNHALSLAEGDYVMGLNNDTVAEGDWQTPLLTEGINYDLCGPTVRRLIICDELKTMLCHRPDGKMADADPSEVGSYVEGWCFFIRRDYWKAIGGFDETWWPMYCEDSDLSFKVKAAGGKIGKVPVPIRHLGGKDTERYLRNDYKDVFQKANAHKMYARWVKGASL